MERKQLRTQYQNNLGKRILLTSIILSSLSTLLVMIFIMHEFLRPSFLFIHMFFIFAIMPIIMMQKLPVLSLIIEEIDNPENPHFQFHFFGKPARRTAFYPIEKYTYIKSESLFIRIKNSKGKVIILPKYLYREKEKYSWEVIENKLKIIKV